MERINSERALEQWTKGKNETDTFMAYSFESWQQNSTSLIKHTKTVCWAPATSKHCSRCWDNDGEQKVLPHTDDATGRPQNSNFWAPHNSSIQTQTLPLQSGHKHALQELSSSSFKLNRVVLCTGEGYRTWSQDARFHILALLFRWERPWASHSTSLLQFPHLKMEIRNSTTSEDFYKN